MTLTIKGPDLDEIMKRLPDPKKARRAAKDAVNDSIAAGRAAAGEEVSKDYNIGPRVAARAKVTKANLRSLLGVANFNQPPQELSKWGTDPKTRRKRQNPAVRGKVLRSRNKIYDGVFLGRLGRKTNAYVRTGEGRFPIRRVYGPSASQLVRADRVQKRFIKRSNRYLSKRLEHHIKYQMGFFK